MTPNRVRLTTIKEENRMKVTCMENDVNVVDSFGRIRVGSSKPTRMVALPIAKPTIIFFMFSSVRDKYPIRKKAAKFAVTPATKLRKGSWV